MQQEVLWQPAHTSLHCFQLAPRRSPTCGSATTRSCGPPSSCVVFVCSRVLSRVSVRASGRFFCLFLFVPEPAAERVRTLARVSSFVCSRVLSRASVPPGGSFVCLFDRPRSNQLLGAPGAYDCACLALPRTSFLCACTRWRRGARHLARGSPTPCQRACGSSGRAVRDCSKLCLTVTLVVYLLMQHRRGVLGRRGRARGGVQRAV